jgi:hypothetical protein
MLQPMPIPQLVEEWFLWVTWSTNPKNAGIENPYIGFDEFLWIVQDFPEHAWQAILAVVADSRTEPFLGNLAAGPMEDLLSYHGDAFIDRVEVQAKKDPKFSYMLGGVWQFQMTEKIWNRVQAVWDRKGWDGIPKDDTNIR